MPEVTCPECMTVTTLERIQRHAGEFCPKCDFPLFWAREGILALAATGASSDEAMRRRPGVGGRRAIGTKVCPTCGEHNPVGLPVQSHSRLRHHNND